MAPSKDIAPLLPETLPEDFNEWDEEAAAAPPPASSREREEWEAGDAFIEPVKPLWQSADSDALLASLVDEPPDFGSALSSSIFVKQQEELINWAGEAVPAPKPPALTGWSDWETAHSFSKAQKSPGQSPDRESFLLPVVDKPYDAGSAAAAPVTVQPQEPTKQLSDGSPSTASPKPESQSAASEVAVVASSPTAAKADETPASAEAVAATRRKADEAVFELFSQKEVEVDLDVKKPKKKRMMVAGICAGAILLPLLIMIPLLHHGTKPVAKQPVQPLPGESVTEVPASMTDTPVAEPVPQGKPRAGTEQTQTTDNQPSAEDEGTTPAQVQSTMMSDQLTAPTRIPKQTAEPENAPPPASDPASAEGLGGNSPNASMFNGHAQPNVRVTRPVPISSGIATGMLIQSPPPVYPPLAKTAHVAGTVEVHATIASNGTIKDARAVSGPVMLRQAAVDAVRNWRYQPYKLNNQPVEVETTINIVFTLGG